MINRNKAKTRLRRLQSLNWGYFSKGIKNENNNKAAEQVAQPYTNFSFRALATASVLEWTWSLR